MLSGLVSACLSGSSALTILLWIELSGRFGGYGQVPSVMNIVSTCTFIKVGQSPLFVNTYSGIEEVGHLETALVSGM